MQLLLQRCMRLVPSVIPYCSYYYKLYAGALKDDKTTTTVANRPVPAIVPLRVSYNTYKFSYALIA
jgi:hypothetical protein